MAEANAGGRGTRNRTGRRHPTEQGEASLLQPIAVVSAGCRTPGDVVDAQGYWRLLDEGRDAVGRFPDRWTADSLHAWDAHAFGKHHALAGGFVRETESFDAGLFGVSPREARAMDPQQRLVLEVAWEALEQAGIVASSLKESLTGVYTGSMGSDYAQGPAGARMAGRYRVTGMASSMLSGRLSYVLGLGGPSMTVDTHCSSSLVALHLACAGLRQGECDLALAGGVQVMSTPATFIEMGQIGATAADGRCKSFSSSADGAGWSEGCGILVLKRLSDVVVGERVLAVIRGSAVNQDGRSQGLTAPNGPSQQRVIRQALASCGLSASDIDAVEAHGTGTPLGDPIEAGALGAVFGPGRDPERLLWLGSSKSNLGHTQAAAGVLGTIKMVLALQHERLPQTLHAEHPSEHIEWEGSGLRLLQQGQGWERVAGRVRRAGVSSFGISGTNAHLIVEEAPLEVAACTSAAMAPATAASPQQDETSRDRLWPLVISGQTAAGLSGNVLRLAEHLEALGEEPPRPGDLAWSLVSTRSALPVRLSLPVGGADAKAGYPALRQALLGFAEHDRMPRYAHVTPQGHVVGKLAVLCSGQGSQRAGMGRGLYGQPGLEAFSAALDAAIAACDGHLQVSLRQVMWSAEDDGELEQTRYAQPALFVLETALYRQWQAWGVEAELLLGHSIGELVAAHLAGVLSLADAALLVCARGRLMQELATPGGAMLSIEASEADVVEALEGLPEEHSSELEVSGLNGPKQTVVSGAAASVAELHAHFEGLGNKSRWLKVSHAFHSHQMEGMLQAFGEVAAALQYERPSCPVLSNVTGRIADPDQGELVSAQYWVQQVRQAVRFGDGVHSALQAGATGFLECGPRGVLCSLVQSNLSDSVDGERRGLAFASLRGEDEVTSLLSALGALHVAGHAVEWGQVFEGSGVQRVQLPTYAFQRQRYWLQAAFTSEGQSNGSAAVDAPLWEAVEASDVEAVSELLEVPESERAQLGTWLPRLAAWHERANASATMQSWRYQEAWKRLELADWRAAGSGASEAAASVWLVAEPEREDGWPEALSEALCMKGAEVERYSVDEALARLVARGEPQSTGLARCILYLPSADPSVGVVPDAGRSGALGCAAGVEALALAQGVCAQGDGGSSRLWFVTPHCLGIQRQDRPHSAALQTLWGLGRSLSLEAPGSFGGLLDLPSVPDAPSVQVLSSFVLRAAEVGEGDDELALRDGTLWTRRVRRAGAATSTNGTSAWHPSGLALVTGGTGALGIQLAHWLAEQGVGHLVLSSRRGPAAPGASDLVQALAAKDCSAEVVCCRPPGSAHF